MQFQAMLQYKARAALLVMPAFSVHIATSRQIPGRTHADFSGTAHSKRNKNLLFLSPEPRRGPSINIGRNSRSYGGGLWWAGDSYQDADPVNNIFRSSGRHTHNTVAIGSRVCRNEPSQRPLPPA